MKSRALILVILALVPYLMAPTGGCQDFVPPPEATVPNVVVCNAAGTPLGVGPATSGDWLFTCWAEVRQYGCGDCALTSSVYDVLLTVPGVLQAFPYAANAALACWRTAITSNLDPELYSVQTGCNIVGPYTAGDSTPQVFSFEDDVEDEVR